MIYKVTKKDIFEDNPQLMAVSKFADCSDRELKYIFLLYDYDSPYAKMSFNLRQEKALAEAGYHREKGGKRFDKNAREVMTGKRARVNEAIGEFSIIQKSANKERALVMALDEQLDHIIQFLKEPASDINTIQKLVKVVNDIPKLLETRKRIKEVLNLAEEEHDAALLQRQVSLLDKYLENEE